MKKLLPLLLSVSFLLLGNLLKGSTDKYRLTLRENPATSIVIGWNQASGSGPVVYYDVVDHGTNWSAYAYSKTTDRTVSYKGMSNNFARLSNLTPNTSYYFVIRDSQGTSSRFWFKTAPDTPTERLSFVAGGDSRNNQTQRRNGNKIVARLRPHAVFFGGDMTSSSTNSEWQTWFEDWQYTTGSDGRMIPIVAARGNHESSNNDIYNLFDVPSSNAYYAITFGGNLVRSYTLNTEMSIGGNQTNWLESDLIANNTAVTWKMAQYHKPIRPHVSSKSEGSNQYNYWAPLFDQYNVKLVVECDAHTVKSTWPVVPSSGSGSDEGFIRDDENGTVYVGEGCWGAPLRSNNDNKTWTRNSGMFNQVKWVFVDQSAIEVRTVKTDNANQVGTVNDNNIFSLPTNLDIWNPSNGSVVTISNTGAQPTCNVSSPADGTHYNTTQQITIAANANDTDGNITQVEFFVNGSSIGTDSNAPYTINWNIPTNGSYAITAEATDNDNNTTLSNANNITVGVQQITKSWQINQSMDDVEENGNSGFMYTNSSDIELVYDGSKGNQVIGLMFRNIDIPQGAAIDNAYIQFTVDETNSGSTSLTIRAHDTNSAADFSTGYYDVSDRTTTSASVSWNPSSWSSVGQASSAQQTPDIKNVVQEVINRSGWASNNKLAIIITGSGERTAESYDGSSSSAARLYVTYTVGSGSSNQTPSVNMTSPANNTEYSSLQTISLSANASDTDGSITQVEFFVNGSSIGTDTSSPYNFNWAIPDWGNYQLTAEARDNEGAETTSSVISISAVNPTQTNTLSVRVSTGNDDAEEAESGAMYRSSSDLELVYDSYNLAGDQKVGVRFRNITIPQGSTIVSAYVQFTVDETKNNSGTKYIHGHDSDNSSEFTASDYNISNRTTTTANLSWNPPSWNSVGAAGSDQQTPDLKNVIQEIVNRSGWATGNALSLIISGSGRRVAESYNGSSSKAPLLVIEYQSVSARNKILRLTENQDDESIILFPNPAFEEITLKGQIDENNKIKVYEVASGKMMFVKDNFKSENKISLKGWAKGAYIIMIEINGSVKVKRFIRQ